MHEVFGLPLLAMLIAVALAVFWVFQFVDLMGRPQEAFEGPWDKYVWAAAFLLVWPVAPFAWLLMGSKGRRGRRS